jgi:hypothetical protein
LVKRTLKAGDNVRMARRSALFRQTDLTRAVKAVVRAGKAVTRAEIRPDGTIVVLTGDFDHNEPETSNEWDVVLKDP